MDSQALTQRLETLSKLHKLLILIVLVVGTLGGYAFFSFMPKLERTTQLEQEIQSLENSIAANRRLAARLPELQEEMAAREYELLLAKMLLPADAQERERLLAAIERLGMDVGVEFLLFQPGSEVAHDFYASREVQLRMRGEFHNLITFFDRMSRLDRLVSLDRLRLQPNAATAAGVGPVTLTAESSIQVYRALTEQEIKAAEERKAQQQQGGRRR
ncbi:type IV pilus assembly protein PilO [Desulfonatronum thiosulfatophilum]|uniref:Type IV pilus assembly protein PilO n=1 Tax=Desulfonatronum thiosulfatophilum TaxID=617002 RepID=A0A1G6ECT3_9BACT|nr:type 4a pilus biogenesis protein PilO [Desulfonatronum thiosulfatophilum]SDB55287.1 type IV pilus assembly protein PilO [Desulfonatronum thiosulfatophilum]